MADPISALIIGFITTAMVEAAKAGSGAALNTGKKILNIDQEYIDKDILGMVTIRAGLLATQVCIQKFHGKKTLEYENATDTEYDYDEFCLPVKKKLKELLKTLKPTQANKKNSKAREKFITAYNESILPISGPSLGWNESDINQAIMSSQQTSSAIDHEVSNSKKIKKIRDSFLPNLENSVVQQILDFGCQASRDKNFEDELRKTLFWDDELWVRKYTQFYYEELHQNQDALKKHYYLLQQRVEAGIGKIAQETSDIKKKIDNISQEFSNKQNENSLDPRLIFCQPSIGKKNPIKSAFRPFYFTEEEDDFVGRISEMRLLKDTFLNLNQNNSMFHWAAVCGDAGVGKSRFAWHILKKFQDTWSFSGFVRKEFIYDFKQELKNLSEIPGPALFIIDYADSAPYECFQFIERCAITCEDFPYPVRIMVLLRRTNDRFFDYINTEEEGSEAGDSQKKFPAPDGYKDTQGALILKTLGEEETLKLMKSRMNNTALRMESANKDNRQKEINDDKLLSILKHYDRDMRPLFALMVADAFQKGLIEIEKTKSNREETRLLLFKAYLQRQFDKRWKKLFGKSTHLSKKNEDSLDRHLTFLILSTMCRGLSIDGWETLVNYPDLSEAAKNILPHSSDFFAPNYPDINKKLDEDKILSGLTGTKREVFGRGFYPVLEPDLIGEALIVLTLDAANRSFCVEGSTAIHREKFLREFAWLSEPDGVAFFSVLLAQDYPEKAMKLNWLLPMSSTTIIDSNIKTKLFRNLVLTTVEPFRNRVVNHDDIKKISSLIKTFQPGESEPVEVQIDFATGLSILSQQLRFVINKSSKPKIDYEENESGVLPDRLNQRSLLFSQAAAKSDFDADSFLNPDPDNKKPVPTLENVSDLKTVEGSIELLHRMYEYSVKYVFSDLDFEVRRLYARIIQNALFSVFWTHRNNNKKFGFANKPLSDNEVQIVETLSKHCDEFFVKEDVEDYTLAITFGIKAAIIFAEDKNDYSAQGLNNFLTNIKKISDSNFSNPIANNMILFFISNHVASEKFYEELKAQFNKKEILTYLINIRKVTEKLFSTAENIIVESDVREGIINRFCSICNAITIFDLRENQDKVKISEYSEMHFDLLLSYTDRNISTRIGSSLIGYLSQILSIYLDTDKNLSRLLEGTKKIFEKSHFDNYTLNNENWRNLPYHFFQMTRIHKNDFNSVKKLIEILIEKIGLPASTNLIDMYISNLPNATLNGVHVEKIVKIGCKNIDEKSKFEKLKLILVWQKLLFEDHNDIFEDMEKDWTKGNDYNDYTIRTFIFNKLQILIYWFGIKHVKILEWRERLKHFLSTSPPNSGPKEIQTIKRHHTAAIETAATFANFEAVEGDLLDDWLLL